jgi:translation initiation factor 2B subunit (eIF-2B alpha/beta/delta family)
MRIFADDLKLLLDDKTSGSLNLLDQLIVALQNLCERHTQKSKIDTAALLKTLRIYLKRHGNFHVIRHFCKFIIDRLNRAEMFTSSEFQHIVEEYKRDWTDISRKVAERAIESINLANKTILILSNSKTIKSLFDVLFEKEFTCKVVQTESRPKNEGRLQAQHIADLGFEVTFITDMAAMLFMDKVDLVLCGADSVYADCFVNKTGSYLLGLAAREFKKPFYVLCDSRKVNPQNLNIELYQQAPASSDEVWACSQSNIHVVNYYFEVVPIKTVSALITEDRTLLL